MVAGRLDVVDPRLDDRVQADPSEAVGAVDDRQGAATVPFQLRRPAAGPAAVDEDPALALEAIPGRGLVGLPVRPGRRDRGDPCDIEERADSGPELCSRR
ncbi:MAG: hypothetical protein A2V84_03780 [Chloroflexi bacterium RBG_16_70_13]|nr:MAG: hypothetical protein A2V84_03780 [Chloroflexi bacterium RBG_16_70_13]